jgi:glycosyltransferase involved in cell wall biosynthesis
MTTATEQIPLIIPVFNQLTFTKKLVDSFRKYYPKNRIYILDNGSTYQPLKDWLKAINDGTEEQNVVVFHSPENDFRGNLRHFLDDYIHVGYPFYAISDPDIEILDGTPEDFMSYFMTAIEVGGLHRAGFGLKTDDIPDYFEDKAMVVGNEAELKKSPMWANKVQGWIAPLDTTFCLYKRDNGGWASPMDGKKWGSCARIFEAKHWGWYIDPNNVSEEMDFYFKTCNKFIPGTPSAGANNNRPKKYENS